MLTEAYEAGREARFDRKPLADNPHSRRYPANDKPRGEWTQGWLDAQRELQQTRRAVTSV